MHDIDTKKHETLAAKLSELKQTQSCKQTHKEKKWQLFEISLIGNSNWTKNRSFESLFRLIIWVKLTTYKEKV